MATWRWKVARLRRTTGDPLLMWSVRIMQFEEQQDIKDNITFWRDQQCEPQHNWLCPAVQPGKMKQAYWVPFEHKSERVNERKYQYVQVSVDLQSNNMRSVMMFQKLLSVCVWRIFEFESIKRYLRCKYSDKTRSSLNNRQRLACSIIVQCAVIKILAKWPNVHI